MNPSQLLIPQKHKKPVLWLSQVGLIEKVRPPGLEPGTN